MGRAPPASDLFFAGSCCRISLHRSSHSLARALPLCPWPHAANSGASCDGVLRWFEAYAEALTSGRFGVEQLLEDPEPPPPGHEHEAHEHPNSFGISLFPQRAPWRSEAITQVWVWVRVGVSKLQRICGGPSARRLCPPQRAHILRAAAASAASAAIAGCRACACWPALCSSQS